MTRWNIQRGFEYLPPLFLKMILPVEFMSLSQSPWNYVDVTQFADAKCEFEGTSNTLCHRWFVHPSNEQVSKVLLECVTNHRINDSNFSVQLVDAESFMRNSPGANLDFYLLERI